MKRPTSDLHYFQPIQSRIPYSPKIFGIVSFGIATAILTVLSLIMFYNSLNETSYLRFQILQFSSQLDQIKVQQQEYVKEIQIKQEFIEKKIVKSDSEIKTMMEEQKIFAISIAILQTKLEQIAENTSIIILKQEMDMIKKDLKESQFVFSVNQNLFSSQMNSTSLKIESINNHIDIIQPIIPKIDEIQSQINLIKKDSEQFQTLKDSLSALSSRINSDTFNKVELFGPYYSYKHENQIPINNIAFQIYQTINPCILTIKGKAVVTLIATGHAMGGDHFLLSFMQDRKVILPKTNSDDWLFGAQFVQTTWIPVNLTQEFIVEAGVYEFVLGAFSVRVSQTGYLNAISFVAKVTYIS